MKLLHRTRPPELRVPAAEEPSVRLIAHVPEQPCEPGAHYLVRDGEGQVHETQASTRQAALRELGAFAVRGIAAPLFLLAPNGVPTGDRLA